MLTELEKVNTEQSRLIRLIQATKSDTPTKEIYLKKLTATEEQLSKLKSQVVEIDAELETAISALPKLN